MTAPTTPVDASTAEALAVARELAAEGVPIFLAAPALSDGTWQPDGGHAGCGYWLPKGWQRTTADPAVIDAWKPGVALCAVMGHAVDALDIDPRSGGTETRAAMLAAGIWPRAYAVASTPSGGSHELVAPLGVASLDGLRPGLDVKAGHEGAGRGFVFIAPTVKLSKTTGELASYAWVARPDLEAAAEGDDSGEALADLIRSTRDGASRADAPADRSFTSVDDDGPRDWMTDEPIPQGYRYPWLRSFAGWLRRSNVRPAEAEVLMRRRWQACAQPPDAIYAMPWADAKALLDDIYRRYEPGGRSAGSAGSAGDPGPWENPIPLVPKRSHAPFPTDALPGPYGEFAAALAEATQTPEDMAGCCALGVLSTCAGGRVIVRARPGWVEPTNLFLVPVMAPGSRKSAVIAAAAKPLYDVEGRLRDEHGPKAREQKALRSIAEAQADEAHRKAAKASPSQREGLTAEALSLAVAVDDVEIPTVPRLLADDVTPEAVAGLLAAQGGRIAVLSAEGGVFDIIAGRYSNNVPNLDVWLKSHAGDPLRVDRRGRAPELIDHPALTMLLTVQPRVLDAIARNGTFAGRGLLARILFSLPEQTVGTRKIGADPVPDDLAVAYAAGVSALAVGLDGWRDDPAMLTLDDDAHEVLLDYEGWVEPKLAPTGEFGGIVDWASKVAGAVVRIAGLLHLAAHGPEGHRTPIGLDTLMRAVQLGGYFLDHARTAFAVLGADPQTASAVAVLAHLRRHHAEEFTIRSLLSALPRSRFATADDVRHAVAALEDHGWVRERPAEERTGPGRRPSPTYDVHPAAQSAEYAESKAGSHSADTADSAAGSASENGGSR